MWRYMIIINMVLGAVLTTPEVLTQVLMAVPLYLLYEASVWVAWYWEQPAGSRARRIFLVLLAVVLLVLAGVGFKLGWPWLLRHWR